MLISPHGTTWQQQSKFSAIFTTKFAKYIPQVISMAQQQEALGQIHGSLPRIYRGDNDWI